MSQCLDFLPSLPNWTISGKKTPLVAEAEGLHSPAKTSSLSPTGEQPSPCLVATTISWALCDITSGSSTKTKCVSQLSWYRVHQQSAVGKYERSHFRTWNLTVVYAVRPFFCLSELKNIPGVEVQ